MRNIHDQASQNFFENAHLTVLGMLFRGLTWRFHWGCAGSVPKLLAVSWSLNNCVWTLSQSDYFGDQTRQSKSYYQLLHQFYVDQSLELRLQSKNLIISRAWVYFTPDVHHDLLSKAAMSLCAKVTLLLLGQAESPVVWGGVKFRSQFVHEFNHDIR